MRVRRYSAARYVETEPVRNAPRRILAGLGTVILFISFFVALFIIGGALK